MITPALYHGEFNPQEVKLRAVAVFHMKKKYKNSTRLNEEVDFGRGA